MCHTKFRAVVIELYKSACEDILWSVLAKNAQFPQERNFKTLHKTQLFCK